MAFQTLPRNGFGPKRKFGQGYIPARPDTSSSSGSSSSSTEVKSETTHTSGNTIVADLSGGSFAALSATLTMERMSSAFLEKVGTPGIGVVQIAGIKINDYLAIK